MDEKIKRILQEARFTIESVGGDDIHSYASLRKKSGVYGFYCKASEKIYIGSSRDLRKRFLEHRSKLRNGEHANTHFQGGSRNYQSKIY